MNTRQNESRAESITREFSVKPILSIFNNYTALLSAWFTEIFSIKEASSVDKVPRVPPWATFDRGLMLTGLHLMRCYH